MGREAGSQNPQVMLQRKMLVLRQLKTHARHAETQIQPSHHPTQVSFPGIQAEVHQTWGCTLLLPARDSSSAGIPGVAGDAAPWLVDCCPSLGSDVGVEALKQAAPRQKWP